MNTPQALPVDRQGDEPPRGRLFYVWYEGKACPGGFTRASFSRYDGFSERAAIRVQLPWTIGQHPYCGACLVNPFGDHLTAEMAFGMAIDGKQSFQVEATKEPAPPAPAGNRMRVEIPISLHLP